jgi:hypothetical protein
MSLRPQCDLLENDIAHYASKVAILREKAASTVDSRLREDILVEGRQILVLIEDVKARLASHRASHESEVTLRSLTE